MSDSLMPESPEASSGVGTLSAETSVRTRLPAFTSHAWRASLYRVLAAYAEMGGGFVEALTNLKAGYHEGRDKGLFSRVEAILDALSNENDLEWALRKTLTGMTPEEFALLAGLPSKVGVEPHRTEFYRKSAVLLRAAAAEASEAALLLSGHR